MSLLGRRLWIFLTSVKICSPSFSSTLHLSTIIVRKFINSADILTVFTHYIVYVYGIMPSFFDSIHVTTKYFLLVFPSFKICCTICRGLFVLLILLQHHFCSLRNSGKFPLLFVQIGAFTLLISILSGCSCSGSFFFRRFFGSEMFSLFIIRSANLASWRKFIIILLLASFSLKFKWQQVSFGLFDPCLYFCRSQ